MEKSGNDKIIWRNEQGQNCLILPGGAVFSVSGIDFHYNLVKYELEGTCIAVWE